MKERETKPTDIEVGDLLILDKEWFCGPCEIIYALVINIFERELKDASFKWFAMVRFNGPEVDDKGNVLIMQMEYPIESIREWLELDEQRGVVPKATLVKVREDGTKNRSGGSFLFSNKRKRAR